jgi:hypothetical protein
VNLLLDLRPQEGEQETQLGLHLHFLGVDPDVAVHTAAAEVQRVAFPGVTHLELGGQFVGNLLGRLAGLRQGHAVGTADADLAHGSVGFRINP